MCVHSLTPAFPPLCADVSTLMHHQDVGKQAPRNNCSEVIQEQLMHLHQSTHSTGDAVRAKAEADGEIPPTDPSIHYS